MIKITQPVKPDLAHETIFHFHATDQELENINFDYPELKTLDEYLQLIDRRAATMKTSADYERFADLQDLASIRGDQVMLKKYTDILDNDLASVNARAFNE